MDENTSLGPLVASLGDSVPLHVALILWKGDMHPLFAELRSAKCELCDEKF